MWLVIVWKSFEIGPKSAVCHPRERGRPFSSTFPKNRAWMRRAVSGLQRHSPVAIPRISVFLRHWWHSGNSEIKDGKAHVSPSCFGLAFILICQWWNMENDNASWQEKRCNITVFGNLKQLPISGVDLSANDQIFNGSANSWLSWMASIVSCGRSQSIDDCNRVLFFDTLAWIHVEEVEMLVKRFHKQRKSRLKTEKFTSLSGGSNPDQHRPSISCVNNYRPTHLRTIPAVDLLNGRSFHQSEKLERRESVAMKNRRMIHIRLTKKLLNAFIQVCASPRQEIILWRANFLGSSASAVWPHQPCESVQVPLENLTIAEWLAVFSIHQNGHLSRWQTEVCFLWEIPVNEHIDCSLAASREYGLVKVKSQHLGPKITHWVQVDRPWTSAGMPGKGIVWSGNWGKPWHVVQDCSAPKMVLLADCYDRQKWKRFPEEIHFWYWISPDILPILRASTYWGLARANRELTSREW
jgi:hypothetical protein